MQLGHLSPFTDFPHVDLIDLKIGEQVKILSSSVHVYSEFWKYKESPDWMTGSQIKKNKKQKRCRQMKKKSEGKVSSSEWCMTHDEGETDD